MIKHLRRLRRRHRQAARANTVFAEALESRRLFDMVYPGDGPVPEEPHAYTLGSKWSTTNLTYSFSNLLDGGMPGGLSSAALESAIEEAFQVWSAVSPLRFTEIADAGPAPADTGYTQTPGMPQIRVGHHFIDGGDGANVLAHGYFPSTSGIGGDLHFDDGNTWTTSPASGIDIIEVATHEIGHTLGLDHVESTVANAIMNPYYGGRYAGPGTAFLLPDDISGIQAQYGAGLGYVVSDGTLFLSGTASSDALSVDVNGSTFTLANGTRTVSGSTSGISNIVVNARGGNDSITIARTGSLAISVNGGAGTDALTLSDKTGTFAGTYTTNASSISRTGLADMTYAATESLTLEGSNANNTFTINTGSVTLRTNGGSDVVNVNTDNGGTASVVFDQSDEAVTTLAIGNGGKVTLHATPVAMQNILAVNTLNLANGGKLDLNNGGMIVDYTSTSPLQSIDASLNTAYADGDWSGNGITSGATGTSGLYTIGAGSASDVLGLGDSEKGVWRGHTIDGSTVLVRFTYAGDANLDGTIDGGDYGVIDNFIQTPGAAGYASGDVNHDGMIDGGDYGLIDNNIQAQGAVL